MLDDPLRSICPGTMAPSLTQDFLIYPIFPNKYIRVGYLLISYIKEISINDKNLLFSIVFLLSSSLTILFYYIHCE